MDLFSDECSLLALEIDSGGEFRFLLEWKVKFSLCNNDKVCYMVSTIFKYIEIDFHEKLFIFIQEKKCVYLLGLWR